LKKLLFISFLLYFLSTNLFSQSNNPDEKTWITNGQVNAIVSNSTHTYLGSEFDYVGPRTGYGVILNTNIYVGGKFRTIGGLTRKGFGKIFMSDGSGDANFDAKENHLVSAIVIDNNDIYVGGYFTEIGG